VQKKKKAEGRGEILSLHLTKHFNDKKESLYRALDLQEVEAARTSRLLAHDNGNIVSPMPQLPLPP
jgi:hypothetical protein